MKKVIFISVLATILGLLSSCNTCYTCQQSSVEGGEDLSLRGQHTVLEIREVCSRSERRNLEKSEQNNANNRVFWTCDKNKDLEDAQEDIDELNNRNGN